MKILIVSHYFPPHVGGIEMIAKKQADSMMGLGNEVIVLTSRHDKSMPLKERCEGGYEIMRLKMCNVVEKRFGITFPIISPFSFFKISKYTKSCDAIHIHDVFYMSSQMTGLSAILNKKPFFITQHVAMVNHPSKIVALIQTLVFRTFGRLLFRKAQAVVVYNANVRDFLIDLGIDSAKILHCSKGVDTEYFSPTTNIEKQALRLRYDLPPNKPIVIFVGRLVPNKGIDLILSASSHVHATLVVGNGKVPKQMMSKDDIIFFGPATQNQLVDLYRLSDIFVFPAAGEIFPLVMQEAMACGLPVLTSDSKNYNYYALDRNLIRFVEREAHAIKSEITMILDNSTLRDNMGKYSRQLALEKFSWELNYPNEHKIYETLRSYS